MKNVKYRMRLTERDIETLKMAQGTPEVTGNNRQMLKLAKWGFLKQLRFAEVEPTARGREPVVKGVYSITLKGLKALEEHDG